MAVRSKAEIIEGIPKPDPYTPEFYERLHLARLEVGIDTRDALMRIAEALEGVREIQAQANRAFLDAKEKHEESLVKLGEIF